METRIFPGDTVQTAKDSELIFVVNTHAMLLRANSYLVIEAGQTKPQPMEAEKKNPNKKPEEITAVSLLISGMRMLAGKLLTVSRNAPMRVSTPTAIIGIRGTGFYVEAEPELTYFCTCYGMTDVTASEDPTSKTSVVSQHHDRPLYVLKGHAQGENIRSAPFINHTDQELTLIEALVGRTPPFVFASDAYNAPRRDY